MPSIAPHYQASGLMSDSATFHFQYQSARLMHGLVVGRAGLDLYPQPDHCKIRDALSFSSDLGGSAGNIAVAMARAGGKVGLISGVSRDAVGDFVRGRLHQAGVSTDLVIETEANERTSLALAEVRDDDCEVVIYRNDPADLQVRCTEAVKAAIENSHNLVVTGTNLIDVQSRSETIAMMQHAKQHDCKVWLDLDYRRWNWPSLETTRQAYGEAARFTDVLVGNEDEFSVLSDDLTQQIALCNQNQQVVLLKKGQGGSILYAPDATLESGIYPVKALKPYGAGDAFLGNLIIHYMENGDWIPGIQAGSAAAAIVVAERGCASAMPGRSMLQDFMQQHAMTPQASWR